MKIGYSVVDITPPLGVELCGYGYFLERKAERIMDRLYARAVSLQQGEKTMLLINSDLIGFTREFSDDIKSHLSQELGLDKTHIMMPCTHTHTGPATSVLVGCGEVDDTYVASLHSLLIQAGRQAFESKRETREIKYFNVPIEPVGFNRVYKDGPVDSNLRGMAFYFDEGRPLAMVNYGCHPVTMGSASHVSADYPGRTVKVLAELGYDALFLNGFCGDINPISRQAGFNTGTEETIEGYGRQIANEFVKHIKDSTSLKNIDMDAFELKIELNVQQYDEAKIDAEVEFFKNEANSKVVAIWAERMKEHLETAEKPYIEEVRVQVFRFGKVLFVGFPGETFTELGLILARSLPEYEIVTLGNCNFTMRYIPTREDIINLGYAGHTSCFIYNRFPLVPGEGERLAEMAAEGIRQYLNK